MAELASIARPYAEALFKAVASSEAAGLVDPLRAVADVASHPQLRQFASSPKVGAAQVVDLVSVVVKTPLPNCLRNLLQTVVDNGRLAALPEIARQFQALVHARAGVHEATVYSAYPMTPAQLAEVLVTLEERFGRKLSAQVVVTPELIGGIRAVVGDEVLDTSVQARLEQMRMALTA
jgi:F-type H+-transporting ATPase subunit delta